MLLRVNVDNPTDKITQFGAGAKLYWARDNASATGTFTDASGSTPLVVGTTQYEIVDVTGEVGHYYRTRIGNDGGTLFDEWSNVFQAGAPDAYATIDALREFLQLPDDSRDNVLSDLLVRVTDKINLSLGFDFFRHPAVGGEEVRLYDGDGRRSIYVTQGISSLSTVRLAFATGQAYSSLTADDWRLRWPVYEGGPFLSVQLTGTGAYHGWYAGYDTVELTGVFGYESIPPAIEQATLMWAADLYRLGAGGGSPLSATGEEFGQERFAGGMPRFTWETVEEFRKRHHGVLVA